jgi:hypothetical protein
MREEADLAQEGKPRGAFAVKKGAVKAQGESREVRRGCGAHSLHGHRAGFLQQAGKTQGREEDNTTTVDANAHMTGQCSQKSSSPALPHAAP